jgi:hypothetical protein
MDRFFEPENLREVNEKVSTPDWSAALDLALSSQNENVRAALESSYQSVYPDPKR